MDGGKSLMEVGSYPFSERYGWVQDKFGISWQLFLGQEPKPIRPCMMFANAIYGKAEEAMTLYTSLFNNSTIVFTAPYEAPQTGVMHAVFMLDGQEIIAMDAPGEHAFNFNEGISFVINCDGQEEVDHFRNKLIADGGQESQCGWLKDKYGFSRQVVPKQLYEYLGGSDAAGSQRAMQAMLQMHKLDINVLKQAYEG
ncbi:VOC family protein [Patescibacteria group bacterium]|nr:VOC family protein [Patescibacteria group bacterium]